MEVVLALSAQPAGTAGGGDAGDAASGAAHGREGAGGAPRSTPSAWSMAPCLGACFVIPTLGIVSSVMLLHGSEDTSAAGRAHVRLYFLE